MKKKYSQQPIDYAPPSESRKNPEPDPYDFREIFKLYGWLVVAAAVVYLLVKIYF
jgi:hypothetical protein